MLGNYSVTNPLFPDLDSQFEQFSDKSFLQMHPRQRFRFVNSVLLRLIQEAPDKSFLLSAVLDFIDKLNRENIFPEQFHFSHFEFWLNKFSTLSDEEKLGIRAKIMGKSIPRDAYQLFFPIGMNRSYYGSHFVAAHLSPDIDTTIASFFGFIDAFAAKVGQGQHLWALPGGPPDSHVITLFKEQFGASVFTHLARSANTLSLSALDLLTRAKVEKHTAEASILNLDHESNEKAIIYVDEKGHYKGDWRASDVEHVRQVTNLFKSALNWFENQFHVALITLFSKEDLSIIDLEPFESKFFSQLINTATPPAEVEKGHLQNYICFLQKVLKLEKGIDSSISDLLNTLGNKGVKATTAFYNEIKELKNQPLFDLKGKLKEDRPLIFHHLQKIFKALDSAIQDARGFVERMDLVMEIKEHVLGINPQFVFPQSDVEEIRTKIRNFDYITVVIPEEKGELYPVGVVRSADLKREALGTVSLRDFSNFQEMKMASYLQVISVIDHHKIDLKTIMAPQMLIGDAQSCNVLIAEVAFKLNDHYSLGGMNEESIDHEIKNLVSKPSSAKHLRLLQRLFQKQKAALQNSLWWVTPEREFCEYLFFLHAILDDTDLLSKVSARDVDCVVELLNRMKSISLKTQTEVLDLSDLRKDEKYAKVAASRLLKNDEMYSIYKKIYEFKEQEVEANILLASQGLLSNFFADTKEQNGCCLVGQTKMFSSNFDTFEESSWALRAIWLKEAENRFKSNPEVDLYIHMISTIPSADEVHNEEPSKKSHPHKDEIWFWIPSDPQKEKHLSRFLSSFQAAPELVNNEMEIDFYGPNAAALEQIFTRSFLSIPMHDRSKETKHPLPIAVLRFTPGTLNSRKSMISPYLPRLIS